MMMMKLGLGSTSWSWLALGLALLLPTVPAQAQQPPLESYDEVADVVDDFLNGLTTNVISAACEDVSDPPDITCSTPVSPLPNSGWKINDLCYVMFEDG
jgi:hypothetical protein